MIDDRVALFFKFGKYKWMKKLTEGEFSFSCAGNFIFEAQKSGNTIQGDENEGVFARLKNDDPRITEMKEKLQGDLEILPDEAPYVMLRRKSSKLKPIFCMYAYKHSDIIADSVSPHPGSNNAKHNFHQDMYSGFSENMSSRNVLCNDERFAQVTFAKSQTLILRLKCELALRGLGYKIDNVNYSEFEKKEFFIPPTSNYDELFYKFPEYKNQHLSFANIFERYSLNIGELPESEYKLTERPFYMITEVVFKERKKF